MSSPIEIRNNYRERIGTIDFNANYNYLSVNHTANGFKIGVSYKLSISPVSKSDPLPVVSNIRGIIFVKNSKGAEIEVGQFKDNAAYSSYRDENPKSDYDTQGRADWYCSFAEMALIENSREGKEPRFRIELWVELYYLLPINHKRHQAKTESEIIYERTELSYPKETWINRLRAANALENVLIEIPLPTSPPSPWDEVWEALISARKAFEQGGN
jgi:hypothetical protein